MFISNLVVAYDSFGAKFSRGELTMWLLSVIGITCIFAVYSAFIPEELSLEQPKIDKNDNLTIPNNQNMFDILLEEVPDEHDARFNDSFTKFDQIDPIPVPDDLTRVASETKAAADEPLLTISPVSVTSTFAPNLAVDQAISSARIAELPSLVDDFTNMFEPIKAPSPIIPTRIPITTRPFVTVLTTPAPPATKEPSTTATLPSTTSSVPITEFTTTTANPSTEEFTTEAITAPTTDLLITTVTVSTTTAEPSTTATLLSTTSFTPTESSSATEGPTTEKQATEVPPVPTTELPTTEGKTSAETTEIFETRKFPTDDVTTESLALPTTEFVTQATTQATTTGVPTSTTTHAAVTTEILSTTQATTTIEIPTSMHQTTTPDAIPSTTDTELPVTIEPTNGSIEDDEDTTKTVTVWALDETKTTTAKPRLSRPWIPQASRLRPTTERVFIVHAEVPSTQNNTISAHNATVQVEGLSSAQKAAIRKFLDAKRHNASVITSTTPIPTIRPTTVVPLAVTKPNPGTGFINPVITNPTQQAVPTLFPHARPVFPFTNFQTFPNQRPVLPFQPLQTNFLPNTANAQNSFFPGR